MFVCPECGASQPSGGHCPADGTPLAHNGDDYLLGTAIGPYRIARLLGMGGMGRVYKGVHPQIGSRVAIKVLSRECSDRRDLVDRFFAEAKAVNLIRHESIVNVLDLSTLPDGRPYIVMEYLDGAPLASLIEHAQRQHMPLPMGGIARLVAEVLDALGAAHAKGIIHRDLKPDNIFVTPAGRPKVLDFGIAKLQPELGGSSTQSGSLLGTPHYMSPEQAAGRSVDLRADLYAIGVILFECMTLQKPFVADSLFDLLRKHVEVPPPPPRSIRHDMPPPLEQVIYTALAKMPEQRFGSTHAMSMALQHATSQLPPDQWAQVTPSTTLRGGAPPGGWSPTPPASWAGSGGGSASGGHASGVGGFGSASAPGRPSVAVGPTQAAGQVTAPPRSGSKKGLWLGLGAVVLVGGGVAVGVIAGGGGGSGGTSAGSAAAAGSAVGSAAVATAGSGSGDAWGAAAEAEATADVDDAEDAQEAQDEIVDVLDETIAQMPPEARKMLPPAMQAALKKYGSWSKIPEAERRKLAAQMAGMTGAMTADAFKQASDALDSIPTGPEPTQPAGGSAPPKPPTPPPPATGEGLDSEGWVESRRFKPPGAFDPTKLDAAKYLPFALAEAKRLIPDAVLFRIDADGVFPDGRADLTAANNGSLDYRFISPSRAKRDPSKPIGAKQEKKCMFRVMIDKDGAWSAPLTGWECKEALIGPPKCSFVQVWKKAIAKGAPSNAIASLGYRADFDGNPRWYFNIYDEDHKVSELFKDDCK